MSAANESMRNDLPEPAKVTHKIVDPVTGTGFRVDDTGAIVAGEDDSGSGSRKFQTGNVVQQSGVAFLNEPAAAFDASLDDLSHALDALIAASEKALADEATRVFLRRQRWNRIAFVVLCLVIAGSIGASTLCLLAP